jgi:hypothetical protein
VPAAAKQQNIPAAYAARLLLFIYSGRLRGTAFIIYLFRALIRHGFYYLFIPAAYAAL